MKARLYHGVIAVMVAPLVALSLGFARHAHAEDSAPAAPRWTPTVALGLGSFDERLRVRLDGQTYDSYRSQWRSFFAIGLEHPVRHLHDEHTWIDGHATLGVGPTFSTGHWHTLWREELSVAHSASRWLTLRAGMGLGLTLDASGADRSFAEVALPLAVTLFRTVDIVYRPFVSLPMGSETSNVFGGDRALSTRLTVLPFEVQLRVRMRALGW